MKNTAAAATVALVALGVGFCAGLYVGESRGTPAERKVTAAPRLYAAPQGLPLLESTDGGASWAAVADERPQVILINGPQRVLASDRRIYESDDGGASWAPMGDAAPR